LPYTFARALLPMVIYQQAVTRGVAELARAPPCFGAHSVHHGRAAGDFATYSRNNNKRGTLTVCIPYALCSSRIQLDAGEQGAGPGTQLHRDMQPTLILRPSLTIPLYFTCRAFRISSAWHAILRNSQVSTNWNCFKLCDLHQIGHGLPICCYHSHYHPYQPSCVSIAVYKRPQSPTDFPMSLPIVSEPPSTGSASPTPSPSTWHCCCCQQGTGDWAPWAPRLRPRQIPPPHTPLCPTLPATSPTPTVPLVSATLGWRPSFADAGRETTNGWCWCQCHCQWQQHVEAHSPDSLLSRQPTFPSASTSV